LTSRWEYRIQNNSEAARTDERQALVQPEATSCISSGQSSAVNTQTQRFQPRFRGWGGRIRTSESRLQRPLPYRLATPHRVNTGHFSTSDVVSQVKAKKGFPGDDLLSQRLTSQVPSALGGLTTGFGMVPGVSPPLQSPEKPSFHLLKPTPVRRRTLKTKQNASHQLPSLIKLRTKPSTVSTT
jgi:hypothetical protein